MTRRTRSDWLALAVVLVLAVAAFEATVALKWIPVGKLPGEGADFEKAFFWLPVALAMFVGCGSRFPCSHEPPRTPAMMLGSVGLRSWLRSRSPWHRPPSMVRFRRVRPRPRGSPGACRWFLRLSDSSCTEDRIRGDGVRPARVPLHLRVYGLLQLDDRSSRTSSRRSLCWFCWLSELSRSASCSRGPPGSGQLRLLRSRWSSLAKSVGSSSTLRAWTVTSSMAGHAGTSP